MMDKDAVMNGLVHFTLPEKLGGKLTEIVKEGFKKAIEEDKEKDKKFQMTKLFDALLPSVEAGELDGAFSLRGPTRGGYTLVGGVKVKRADQLMKTIFQILKELPAEDKNQLKLNADKSGDVAIHRLDLKTQFDAKTKEIFGDHPIYFAFRKDAVYLALGEGGLKAIKQAVVAPTVTGPPVMMDMSLARLVQLMAKTDEKFKGMEKLLEGKNDRLRMTMDGGELLRVRLEMNLAVVAAIGQAGAQGLFPGGPPPPPKEEKKQ